LLAGCLLCACGGSSTRTPQNTPAPTATATNAPSASASGTVDAHQLTFQRSDIPPGFAPHPRAILTIDANTVVSEKLLRDGGLLGANGFQSGAEYGWERPSDHRMAAECVVMVFDSADHAHAVFTAMADAIKTYMAENDSSAMFADSEYGFHQGDLDLALAQQGRIDFLVQTSSASPQNDVDLAMNLDKRLQPYGGSQFKGTAAASAP
jgi:hypothetical protein